MPFEGIQRELDNEELTISRSFMLLEVETLKRERGWTTEEALDFILGD